MPSKTTDEGRRAWDELVKYFKSSHNPKLVELALGAQVIGQKSAIENSIPTYDLLIEDPNSFATGAKAFDPSFNCVLNILIPRTQYIPFENIQNRIRTVKKKNKALSEFTRRATKYYRFIEKQVLVDDDFKCKRKAQTKK